MIDPCTLPRTFNHSWVLAWLAAEFPRLPTVDLHHRHLRDMSRTKRASLVYVDDELFWDDAGCLDDVIPEWPQELRQNVYVVKVLAVHDLLRRHGLASVHCPWFDVLEDCFAYVRLPREFCQPDTSLCFSCLNRRHTQERLWTISELDRLDLVPRGFVTGNYPNDLFPAPLRHRQCLSVLPHPPGGSSPGYERTGHVVHGVEASTNVVNTDILARHVPGLINITVESSMQAFFPTEKSIQGFVTHRIPMILAQPGRITELRDWGFDMFDDVLNHDYDTESGSALQRVTKALESNRSVLAQGIALTADVRWRLRVNYQHLLRHWFPDRLDQLRRDVARVKDL